MYNYYFYDAFMAFFDYHLKNANPEFLYTSVSNEGTLSSSKDLFVQFSAPVTEESVKENIVIKNVSGSIIEGNWSFEGKGNKWIFKSTSLIPGSYKITIGNKVCDANNKTISKASTVDFIYS